MTIGEIGAQGDGVTEIEGGRVHVPLTAPGDIALVEARGERGLLIELVGASPHRAEPPCPHYGACGGCSLQHVSPEFYRTWKRGRVVEALARAGLREANVADLVETPAASRRRATFAVKKSKEGAVLGFNARHSAAIIGIEACRILHPNLLALLPALRSLSRSVPASEFDLAVTLCRNGVDVDVASKSIAELRGTALQVFGDHMRAAAMVRLSVNREALITIATPIIEFDGIAATPPPGGFLQASKEGEAALLALVKEATAGARKIADLFAGCGSFALPLARTSTVLAADSDAAAIAALASAAANAQRAGQTVNPVHTEIRNLFERPLMARELNDFDTVVFDPPRSGASEQAAELAKSRVKTIVGVSCNPSTFARDAAILSQGGYRPTRVTPVDQFVYSPHVELVGVFQR